MALAETLLELIYPRICLLCDAELGADDPWVCARCLGRIPRIMPPVCPRCGEPIGRGAGPAMLCSSCRPGPRPFDRAASGAPYLGVVRDLVQRLKYRRQVYVAPVLARLAEEAWRAFLDAEPVDAVVPVPLHPRKEREREFNQAERIAESLASAIGAPLRAGWLRRVRDTASQTELNRRDRRANVADAFVAGRRVADGARVILVDDVYTTGATVGACASVLRAAGAARIVVVTPARD